MGIFRVIADRFGQTIEIVETETVREAVEGARRDVRHFRFFNGEVYASIYRTLDDCNAKRPFVRVHSSGKLFRVGDVNRLANEILRLHAYGRACARWVVRTQPDNATLDGRIDQAIMRGARKLEGRDDFLHDVFYCGVRSVVEAYSYDGCERCGADFERPTVGKVCRKCRIQEWVTGDGSAADAFGETLERFDFESEAAELVAP